MARTRSFLSRHGVRDLSEVAQILYRDGAWPGNVRCLLKDGRSFAVPKFHFNHLISFHVLERCLLCTDLAAEGADLSVADAWGTGAEAGEGSSLVVSRTVRGEAVLSDLASRGILEVEEIGLERAVAMHAHGLDLKKTGAFLRIQRLREKGKPAPRYDLPEPSPSLRRQIVEMVVSGHFRLLRTRPWRWIVDRISFRLLGGLYTAARRVWKKAAVRKYQKEDQASQARRRPWVHWWRFLGPLLLLLMLWRVGPEKCWLAVRNADLYWFLGACLLSLPALFLKAVRWQEIVRALGFPLSLAESTGVYAAGMLAGAVTPGKVGDLAKAPLLLSRGIPLNSGIAASLLDRVFDGVVLLGLGLAGVLALPALPGRGIVALGATAALGLTIGAACLFRRTFARALRLQGIHWPLAVTTTLAAAALYFGSASFCAEALGLPLTVWDVVVGASVAAVLALLPVSVAGIGTRDAAFVVIFAQCGINPEQALALSTLILAWMLVNCLLFLVASRFCSRGKRGRESFLGAQVVTVGPASSRPTPGR